MEKEWSFEDSLLKKRDYPKLELVKVLSKPMEGRNQRTLMVKNGEFKCILKIFSSIMEAGHGMIEAENMIELSKKTDYVAKVIDKVYGLSQYEILYEFVGISLYKIKNKYLKMHEQPTDGVTCHYFTAKEWVNIMQNLLDGFTAQEALRMMHIDIKPENLVYDAEKKTAKIPSHAANNQCQKTSTSGARTRLASLKRT